MKAAISKWGNAVAPNAMRVQRRLRIGLRRALSSDLRASNCHSHLPGEPWWVDNLQVSDSRVTVTGWAFPPVPGLIDKVPAFTINGTAFDTADVRLPRPDVGHKFWQRNEARDSGFVLVKNVAGAQQFASEEFLELDYLTPGSRLPRGLRHIWALRNPSLEAPMPSSEQRVRVIGNDDETGFRMTGATDYRRLDRAAQAFGGKRFDSYEGVLDWGCGCGRVARYATSQASKNFVGCDIDGDNVSWCKANLPGTYVQTALRPPLPFEDGAFSLVYGVSVFTHFREAMQDAWLAELRRIVRPGGLVLVTTHGATAIDYAGLEPAEYVGLRDAVARQGILFSTENTQLDGAVDHEAEYVNVYHSKNYINTHWREWFDVVEIIPGYIFTHDLVVLRRRA